MNKTKVIAVVNHKGGVSKTTSVFNIGSLLAKKGYKTLLVDLDAQANLTYSLLPDDEEPQTTIYDSLKDDVPLPVIKMRENLSLVPSELALSSVELTLASKFQREFILKELLDAISQDYDFVLLDCPPSLGLLTLNALVASTDIIIPIQPELYANKGIGSLLELVENVKKRVNKSLRVSAVLLTRYGGRNLNKAIEENLKEEFGDVVLDSKIRENISVAEAPAYKKDVVEYAPQSNGAEDYIKATDELLAKLK